MKFSYLALVFGCTISSHCLGMQLIAKEIYSIARHNNKSLSSNLAKTTTNKAQMFTKKLSTLQQRRLVFKVFIKNNQHSSQQRYYSDNTEKKCIESQASNDCLCAKFTAAMVGGLTTLILYNSYEEYTLEEKRHNEEHTLIEQTRDAESEAIEKTRDAESEAIEKTRDAVREAIGKRRHAEREAEIEEIEERLEAEVEEIEKRLEAETKAIEERLQTKMQAIKERYANYKKQL